MLSAEFINEPWVLLGLSKEIYGLPARYVREMIKAPNATRVPMMPPHVRGVINLRGSVMPVVDLRLLLGMESSSNALDELIDNLNKREQDHKNWLSNLEVSVLERKPFTGATDPHKCAFGIWYDSFTTDNVFLKRVLVLFDTPHKRIHAIAEKVKELEAKGKFEAAIKIIEETRNKELAAMIKLFDEARETLREYMREIVVVLSLIDTHVALTVDQAMTVETLNKESFSEAVVSEYSTGDQLLAATARRKNTDELVLLFDAEHLMQNIMASKLQ
jgi:chemotaxis signal transduction protein